MTTRPRVFSGIQPTGTTHLGNYLGAIRNWVAMQDETDALFCIVDLHALTMPKEPGEVAEGSMRMARTLLAAGLDPERCILFVQSHVREHAELGWLMQTVTSYGELSRMVQFKDKADAAAAGEVKGGSFISAGLFTYPALQAADILLYDTNIVPVGDDQKQHIELTRDVAERFNHRYGETFVIPEHRVPAAGARVMDLQHPDRKMSKSLDSPQGTVELFDEPKAITKKFKRAVTDSDGEVRFDIAEKPGVSNLLSILAAVTDGAPEALAEGYEQYGPLKGDVAEAVVAALEPIQERYAALNDDDVRDALRLGADKARAIAEPVMERARRAAGLLV